MAEEPHAVEEPEHSEEQKETVGWVKTMKLVKQSNWPPSPPLRLLPPLLPLQPLPLLLPPLPLPLPNHRLTNPPLLSNTRRTCHPLSRAKTVGNNHKIDFLEGPSHPSIAVYRKCERGSNSKSYVLSSNFRKDIDTLYIVAFLSLLPILTELIPYEAEDGRFVL